MSDLKKEASVAGGIKGFMQGGPTNMVKRKRVNQPFNEKVGDPIQDPELFENEIIASELGFVETVRKRGNQWVLYDDDTDTTKAVYSDRDTAWEKQRIMRQSEKTQAKHKESEKERKKHEVPAVDKPFKAPTPEKATEPKKAPKAEKEKKKEKQKVRALESVQDLFNFLNEGSMVSYVFENSPMSEESDMWDNFINKLSKQTVMADPKLNKIIHSIAKSEVLALKKSINTVKDVLEASGRFMVQSGNKIERDATNDPKIDFFVSMKDNKKKLQFGIKLDNNRPLIMWEEAKDILDQMANEESKLLRAELIHIQETSFKKMDDIISSIEKRDKYLKSLEQKFDKVLSNINPLEMNMLKYLLKDKYKTVR